jgi:hypothetical protein
MVGYDAGQDDLPLGNTSMGLS